MVIEPQRTRLAMGKRVLVVDDDFKLQGLLREYLTGYGFEVMASLDGADVLQAIRRHSPDLAILDIMLPRLNGLDLLKAIRAESAVPVIMLTAKGEETDRIVGLEMGADDYLAKPFNPRELLARMRAVLRRRGGAAEAEGGNGGGVVEAAGLTLDTERRLLRVEGQEIELSPTESKIMAAMMARPNAVFSRDALLNLARGRDLFAFDRSVDVHISNLRSKLKPFPRFHDLIKTVWGTGYMLVEKDRP
jgi:two-component system phosphate regulon response regulator OmpR